MKGFLNELMKILYDITQDTFTLQIKAAKCTKNSLLSQC